MGLGLDSAPFPYLELFPFFIFFNFILFILSLSLFYLISSSFKDRKEVFSAIYCREKNQRRSGTLARKNQFVLHNGMYSLDAIACHLK